MSTPYITKIAYKMGLRCSDLIPCRTRMKGAGKSDPGTIGVFVLCLEATTKDGATVRSKQLAYVCKNVTDFYLSNTVLKELGIIPK